jgi:hypothetical protein
VLGAAPLRAATIPVDDGKWDLQGPGVSVGTHDGRAVINVETGVAFRRDVSFQDGTISFDVQVTRRRSFVYLWFRMADDRETEEFYLRPHKSGLPDALQYAPVFQGHSQWQLHHGPGGTAAVEFNPGAWTRVRVVARGTQAALFLGDGPQPALLVPRLARAPRAGYIALRASTPPGTPGSGPVARFANVRVEPDVADFAFPPAPAAAPAPGVVTAWAVSRAWAPREGEDLALPAADSVAPFSAVRAEPSGLVQLHRSVALPEKSRAGAAVARVRVRAAQAGLRAFDLGFSDDALVLVNGKPLFRGEGSYSYDEPRREGLIGYDQARVFLPLVEGDNDLAVVVQDGFGGWGLMGRFPDPSGLVVDAQ